MNMSDVIALSIIGLALIGLYSLGLAVRNACRFIGTLLAERMRKGVASPLPTDNNNAM
jgi:hypothetical protein